MLYGIITGINWFREVEDATAGRIDWSLTGGPNKPWPPDAWIEGNNGREAMRVHYKGESASFPYDEYRDGDHVNYEALGAAVLAFIDQAIADDPDKGRSEARPPRNPQS